MRPQELNSPFVSGSVHCSSVLCLFSIFFAFVPVATNDIFWPRSVLFLVQGTFGLDKNKFCAFFPILNTWNVFLLTSGTFLQVFWHRNVIHVCFYCHLWLNNQLYAWWIYQSKCDISEYKLWSHVYNTVL